MIVGSSKQHGGDESKHGNLFELYIYSNPSRRWRACSRSELHRRSDHRSPVAALTCGVANVFFRRHERSTLAYQHHAVDAPDRASGPSDGLTSSMTQNRSITERETVEEETSTAVMRQCGSSGAGLAYVNDENLSSLSAASSSLLQ